MTENEDPVSNPKDVVASMHKLGNSFASLVGNDLGKWALNGAFGPGDDESVPVRVQGLDRHPSENGILNSSSANELPSVPTQENVVDRNRKILVKIAKWRAATQGDNNSKTSELLLAILETEGKLADAHRKELFTCLSLPLPNGTDMATPETDKATPAEMVRDLDPMYRTCLLGKLFFERRISAPAAQRVLKNVCVHNLASNANVSNAKVYNKIHKRIGRDASDNSAKYKIDADISRSLNDWAARVDRAAS